MMMRVLLTVFLCLLLLGMPTVPAQEKVLKEGEGHGYSWIIDFSDFREEVVGDWQRVDDFHLSGGSSEMVYVRCTGNNSGIYEFEYFGGNYVDLYLRVSGTNATGIYNSMDYRARYSINYNGSFSARKYYYSLHSGGEEHAYYGIDNLTVDVGGDIEVSLSAEKRKISGVWTYFMRKSSNISYSDLRIEFEEPYPFVPAEDSDWVYNEDIRIRYSGNRSGHIDYSAQYPDGNTDSLRAYVGKHVSGTTTVSLYSMFFSNGTMYAPSFIALSHLVDMTPYKGHLLDLEEEGLEMEFWQRYDNGTITAIGQSASPAGDIVWSLNASEDEVNAYLQDKASYTPEPVEESFSTDMLAYILLASLLVTAVAVGALFLAVKKRREDDEN